MLPLLTRLNGPGLCPSTVPSFWPNSERTSTTKPASSSCRFAWSSDLPITLGTNTIRGPLLNTRCTVEPRLTRLPAGGTDRITAPAGMSSLNSEPASTARSFRPVRAATAADCDLPASAGMVRGFGPLLKNRVTREPRSTEVPDLGSVRMALPVATSSS